MIDNRPSMCTRVADALHIPASQVEAAVRLLDEGATVPFIARYRKEVTGGLSDVDLRALSERLFYMRELEARRDVVIESLKKMNVLTDALLTSIQHASTKTELEDLYLPYRPKRRTKASQAKEAGLEPLAVTLLADRTGDLQRLAAPYLAPEHGIHDVDAALEGARHVLMDLFSEDALLLQKIRQHLWDHGLLKTNLLTRQKGQGHHQYADYAQYQEPIKRIPSHRALALFRARREQVIQFDLVLPSEVQQGEQILSEHHHLVDDQTPNNAWLKRVVHDAWTLKIAPKLASELFARLRELADDEAIRVFSRNLKALLLAAPAGRVVTMGLDPGFRTGVKVAVVDATGKVLHDAVVYPMGVQGGREDALSLLAKLVVKYQVQCMSIGNGTGARETTRLVKELMSRYPDLPLTPVLVSEAGASVYSASALASEELPMLDVTLRGAVSIARRLQDPLAELVKIEPKAMGVGQYQHDVNPTRLLRRLQEVVEDCVNAVGVDVNTASVSLLTYVSGLNEGLAKQIVAYRDAYGPFKTREDLKRVPRMGEKTFEQCAGFLRILDGSQPLDASAVHPESYALVQQILDDQALSLQTLMGNPEAIAELDRTRYISEHVSLATVNDVLQELEKPGRDPRPAFKVPLFQEGVEAIEHLQLGMSLEGVVSNVTNFGAFVDVGVHQDGLVHISELADRFVKDPHAIVRVGDVVCVKVIELDVSRRRIGLSMRVHETKSHTVSSTAISSKTSPKTSPQTVVTPKAVTSPHVPQTSKKASSSSSGSKPYVKTRTVSTQKAQPKNPFNTAMADALSKLKKGS